MQVGERDDSFEKNLRRLRWVVIIAAIFAILWSLDQIQIASSARFEITDFAFSPRDQSLFVQYTRMRSKSVFGSIGFSFDNTQFDGGVAIYDMNSDSIHNFLKPGTGFGSFIAVSPNGKTLAVELDAEEASSAIMLFDVDTGGSIASLAYEQETAYSMSFSPNGKLLAAGFDDVVVVWDIPKQKQIAQLPHPKRVYSLSFLPTNNVLASASADGSVRFWNVIKKVELGVLDGYPPIAISPDGKILACPSFATKFVDEGSRTPELKVVVGWDIRAIGESKSLLDQNTSRLDFQKDWSMRRTDDVYALALSPDITLLAATGDKETEVWNVETGELVKQIEGSACSLAFSPDGNILAIGDLMCAVLPGGDNGNYGTVSLWNIASGAREGVVSMPHAVPPWAALILTTFFLIVVLIFWPRRRSAKSPNVV